MAICEPGGSTGKGKFDLNPLLESCLQDVRESTSPAPCTMVLSSMVVISEIGTTGLSPPIPSILMAGRSTLAFTALFDPFLIAT